MIVPFNYLPLLIVFGFLAVLDLLDAKRINVIFILFGIFVLFFMNKFTIEHGAMLFLGIISSLAVLFVPHLGNGDKMTLIASFLIYPFYWIWLILFLAILISKPFLGAKSWLYFHVLHRNTVSVAFYPYLFLSVLLIVFIFSFI